MTIEKSIENALFERVASLVLNPALPVAWPNIAFQRPATGYLRVTHVPNTSRRRFVGSTEPHQRRGILQIDVFLPLNGGATKSTENAGKVAQHFPTDLKLPKDGLTVRITKAPDIAQGFSEETYWQVPLTISYDCFA